MVKKVSTPRPHGLQSSRKVITKDSLERDEVGRFIDLRSWVLDIKYEDLDAVIDRFTSLSRMYGPFFSGTIFCPQWKNVYTGDEFTSGHHAHDGSAKTKAHFIKGFPGAPMHCVCQQIKQWSPTIGGSCGNEFTFDSPGCTEHPNVHGRGRNHVFVLLKTGQDVTIRDILLPWKIESILGKHAEAMQADRRAIENQEFKAAAEVAFETKGTYEYQYFNSKRRNTTCEEPEVEQQPALENLRKVAVQKRMEVKMRPKPGGIDPRTSSQAQSDKQKEKVN